MSCGRSAAVLLIALVSGCGVFFPGDTPEDPISGRRESDPFNFAAILAASGEQFGQTEYRRIFTPDFRFIEDFGSRTIFDREELIGRLDRVVDTCDTIGVKWARNTGVPEPGFTQDTVELLRRYRVYWSPIKIARASGGAVLDSSDGLALLTLVRAAGKWSIHRWLDGPGLSIFHPRSTVP